MVQKSSDPKIFGVQKSLDQARCWSKKIKAPKILAPNNVVKIGSVTAEIFPIWTNVARTNVTWTNVTLTVGICSKCSQEPTLKVSSKIRSVTAEILLTLSLCGVGV